MMTVPDDRIEQLIAGSLAGELTPDEQRELDGYRAEHPWIDAEITSLTAILDAASDTEWEDADADDALRQRVLEATVDAPASVVSTDEATSPAHSSGLQPRTTRRERPRRVLATALLAAACLVVGAGAALAVERVVTAPPSGPPGALGAVEDITLVSATPSADLTLAADLVAHTWGTEAILSISGLDAGATYTVVFIGADGTEYSAGEMLGSTVQINCRLNAAVMREDVTTLEIRSSDAQPVAVADLPAV